MESPDTKVRESKVAYNGRFSLKNGIGNNFAGFLRTKIVDCRVLETVYCLVYDKNSKFDLL